MSVGVLSQEEVMTESTAIVQSPRVAYMRALKNNLVWIASITDQSRNEMQEKVDRMLDRLVTEYGNGEMPLVVNVTFKPIKSRNGTGIVIDDMRVSIPDPKGSHKTIDVPARAHLVVDGKGSNLPYFGVQQYTTGEGVVKYKAVAKTHWCMVLEPRTPRDRYYRLLPLALGTHALTRWNNIALNKRAVAQPDQMASLDQEWPIIEPFDHCLELPDRFRDRDLRRLNLCLEFKPLCYEPCRPEDPKSENKYGSILGQTIVDQSDGAEVRVPAPDQEDAEGNACFGKHVFRIFSITETSIRVLWEGAVGIAKIQRQETMKFEKPGMNGYQALGLKQVEVNPLEVHEYALKLAADPLDDKNILYVYARNTEEILEDWQLREVRLMMKTLAMNAAYQLQHEIQEVRREMLSRYSTAVLPTFQEVLGGKSFAKVWFAESGDDDVIAHRIATDIESEFRWDSWLHTRVRLGVLEMIASKEGIQPPESEEETVSESTDSHAADSANPDKKTRKPRTPRPKKSQPKTPAGQPAP